MFTSVINPIIISRSFSFENTGLFHDNLSEAVRLTEALPNTSVLISLSVKIRKPDPSKLFGRGQIKKLCVYFTEKKIKLVVVNGELNAIQQRNLETEWNLKVLDRTAIILEIFGSRAMSREGVLQVELAHLNYQKSRLVRSWTHLERQRGGMGFLGGPGETQIEADKRAINSRIIQIKQALEKVVKTRGLHRIARKKIPYPTVALVGYTNAGKSSVFNRLTGATALTKDMLFATLDPKMKGLKLPSGQKVIVSDTVGFISKLPTLLIAAFKATLEEVVTADLILHVRDISSNNFDEQAEDVELVLSKLGIVESSEKVIEVWNKEDKIQDFSYQYLNMESDKISKNKVIVSAKLGNGFQALLHLMASFFNKGKKEELIFIPFTRNKSRSWLLDNKLIIRETAMEKGSNILVYWTDIQRNKFISDFS